MMHAPNALQNAVGFGPRIEELAIPDSSLPERAIGRNLQDVDRRFLICPDFPVVIAQALVHVLVEVEKHFLGLLSAESGRGRDHGALPQSSRAVVDRSDRDQLDALCLQKTCCIKPWPMVSVDSCNLPGLAKALADGLVNADQRFALPVVIAVDFILVRLDAATMRVNQVS